MNQVSKQFLKEWIEKAYTSQMIQWVKGVCGIGGVSHCKSEER